MPSRTPNFDILARPYRWLEYLTFGPFLERCRFYYLSRLGGCGRALILGDGDGRFTARLLTINPEIIVDAIDSSAAMLAELTQRVAQIGPATEDRLRTLHTDARDLNLQMPAYDLVVTHFFLDCLSEDEMPGLLEVVRPCLVPNATWIVSEFAVPERFPMKWLASFLVAALYQAFGILTGLRIQKLPNYALLFHQAGFQRVEHKSFLGGLLVSELWKTWAPGATGDRKQTSQ